MELSAQIKKIEGFLIPNGYTAYVDFSNHITAVARFCLAEIEVLEDVYPGF